MTPKHKLTTALHGRITAAVENDPDGPMRLKAKLVNGKPIAIGVGLAQVCLPL
ncbi:MAG: hypothetical protein JOY96_05645 [Verrucomicrobia bacterium]|nr:hypothetical protein [Verrucomicrobiota bacterium]